jgi:hypothetical protein
MFEMGAALIFLSIVAAMPAYLYYVRKLYRLSQALQFGDPDIYKSLHKPSMKLNMSPISSVALVRFVWLKGYNTSESEQVRLSGEKARLGFIASGIVMLSICVGVVLVNLGGANV